MSELRIMTYNMLHAPGDHLQELLEVVQSAQPDILACQEIDDLPGLLDLSQRSGMPAVIGYSNQPEDPPAAEHLALLSRWPIVHLHTHPGDRTAMFRPVLEVWVAPPGVSVIRCFVVHFRAFVGTPGSRVKMREVEHLCSLLTSDQANCIALGDFNAMTPGEIEFPAGWGEQLPQDHREAVQGGVISRLLETGMVDTWRQFNDPACVPAQTLRDRASARVDYIWADPELARCAVESKIIHTPEAERASDHFPVVTTFHLPELSY